MSVGPRRAWRGLLLLLAAGCGHSDAFVTAATGETLPFGTGNDLRLTWNAEQDYWPAWTEDSAAVLYAFIPEGRADHDRCIGLVAPTGGTRQWQLCETQPGHADSTDSFAAYALGRDGRLLYQEVSARIGREVPATNVLWLADSAHPFERRKLLTFPQLVNGAAVDWLADLAWTGPTTFIGLAAEYTPVPHCPPKDCAVDDSAFVGKFLVRGTITANGATLAPISGTVGASHFSLAESGNSIVFSRRSGSQLYGVPASGGSDVLLVNVGSQSNITGVSCRGTTCVVATAAIVVLPNSPNVFPNFQSPRGSLYRVNLSTASAVQLRSHPLAGPAGIYATPLIAPNGVDVLAQSGGLAGHLQSATSSLGDIYLYKGLLP